MPWKQNDKGREVGDAQKGRGDAQGRSGRKGKNITRISERITAKRVRLLFGRVRDSRARAM